MFRRIAPNILQRDFATNAPHRKWTTDVSQVDPVQCTKILHNGKLFIISEKKTYTLTGQETK